jgi:hypothetical protein
LVIFSWRQNQPTTVAPEDLWALVFSKRILFVCMKPLEPLPRLNRLHRIEAWWPVGLGQPASAGTQDSMRYAFFPEKQLLLIEENGKVKTFDSGRHNIRGVSQDNTHTRSLAFTSQHGPVRVQDLKRLS